MALELVTRSHSRQLPSSNRRGGQRTSAGETVCGSEVLAQRVLCRGIHAAKLAYSQHGHCGLTAL